MRKFSFGRKRVKTVLVALVATLGLTLSSLTLGPSPASATPDVCATPPTLTTGQFVTCWDTSLVESWTTATRHIRLPLRSGGDYSFNVDWGDGTTSTGITAWDAPEATHTYATDGRYWITITGTIRGFSFGGQARNDVTKLIDVAQWGPLALAAQGQVLDGYFAYGTNFQFSAADAPDLSTTVSLLGAFAGATNFNSRVDHWNVSNVVYMSEMFKGAAAFNNGGFDLDWGAETANVITTGMMFQGASNFNSDVSNWDTSSLTNASSMFYQATVFDQNLSEWDTADITNFSDMFFEARAFNNGGQPLEWNVKQGYTFTNMFAGARALRVALPNWKPGFDRISFADAQRSTVGMFDDATNYNPDLSSWDMSAITTATHMLRNTGISTANYNALLAAWGSQNVRTGVDLGDVGGVTSTTTNTAYGTAGLEGRTSLIANSWTMNDGGYVSGASTTPTFLDTTMGSSTSASMTLSNDQAATFTLADPPITISGAGAGAFSVASHTCGASLAAAQSCTVELLFAPQQTGAVNATATVNVTSERAMPATISSSLSGIGTLAAPTALSAVPLDQSLEISFTAPDDGGNAITNYEYSVNDGVDWNVLAPSDTSSPITITGLTNGSLTNVKLRAVNSIGAGVASTAVSSTPRTLPGTPRNTGTEPGNGQVRVTWEAPLSDGGAEITEYTVSASPGGDTCTWESGPLECTVQGLRNGDAYTFTVAATNIAGTGSASAPSASSSPRTVPAAPVQLASTVGDGQFSIAFVPGDNGGRQIVNYEYSLDAGSTWTVFTPAVTTSPVVITGVANGTTYRVQLRAVNEVGSGVASTTVNVTPVAPALPAPEPTPEPAPTPAQPAGLAPVSAAGAEQVPLRKPPTTSVKQAPVVQVPLGDPFVVSMRSVPEQVRFTVQVQSTKTSSNRSAKWSVLGKAKSDKRGRVKLPALDASSAGQFLIRLVPASGKPLFVKVAVG